MRKILFPDPKGWNFSIWFWSFYNTKFTEICWNDNVFEFPKEHQRCSRKHKDFNAIEIMCLRQAQAPCNGRIGGWACRSHCVWNFSWWWGDEVMMFFWCCLPQAQAACNKRIDGWACRSHRVMEELVAELVEATYYSIFLIFSVRGVSVIWWW